jgi:hypothetical protein
MIKDSLGIYVPSKKTFYYLEAGDSFTGNTVDRIKKTLVQRNIINISIDGSPSNYTVLYKKQFTSKYPDYNAKPIFISKHIEQHYKQGKIKDEPSSGLFKN